MSRLQAEGDVRGMLELNSRANVLVALLLYPAARLRVRARRGHRDAGLHRTYLEAAPVMRVYIAGVAIMVVG